MKVFRHSCNVGNIEVEKKWYRDRLVERVLTSFICFRYAWVTPVHNCIVGIL